MITSYHTTR